MLRTLGVLAAVVGLLLAGRVAAEDFAAVRDRARGQTVYFNHWGGSTPINDYIAWVGGQARARFGIELVSVKLTETAEAVARIVAEKAAGRNAGGSVDLVWINGPNFKALKDQGLLHGPFAQSLPNFRLVDTVGKPTTLVDFTVPTDGLESPWGMAQLVLFHDSARVPQPPRGAGALLEWIEAHPGRFTFPAPPNFMGSTFLKQLVYAAALDKQKLARPVDPATFAADTAGLWAWLDAARPALWRQGRAWPASGPALHQLLADGEVDFSMAFNPAEASNLILQGQLPDSVRSFVLDGGTIGNTHFVAIPFNAAHKEGAMVIADFLLSPEAQARKQDPAQWGDPTVLDVARLDPAGRALFAGLPRGPATLSAEELGPVLPEPHPSWMTAIEAEWQRRYAS